MPKLLADIDAQNIDLSSYAVAGPEQAVRFTWAESARLTAQVYGRELSAL